MLCTDKTGTLTENRMTIAELRIKNGTIFRPSAPSDAKMPECFHDLVEFGILLGLAFNNVVPHGGLK